MTSTTRVWHSNDTRNTMMFGITLDVSAEYIKELFQGKKYAPVAVVDSTNLDEVFMLTNNIDTPWTENEKVRAVVDSARSSSVGDIFVNDEGVFVVAGFGFHQLYNKATGTWNLEYNYD